MKKEVVDKEGILKIINALFARLPVFSQDSSGREISVKVIAMRNQGLVVNFKIKLEGSDRVLTLNHNNMKFIAEFKSLGGDGNGIEILLPKKIIMLEASRESTRVAMVEGVALDVTNIVNVNNVSKALGFDDDKVYKIIQNANAKLKTAFEFVNIFLSARMDTRLRLMHSYDKPIYITNRKLENPPNHPDYLPYEEYGRIWSSSKLEERFISEISIPLKYKSYADMGYIQILAEKPLDEKAFQSISVFAGALSKEIIASGLFQESKEMCPLLDISGTGLSFSHPQSRQFSRYVILGDTLIFDMYQKGQKRGTLRAIIKNIKNLEKDFRVGCQFYNLNPKDEEVLKEIISIQSEGDSGKQVEQTQSATDLNSESGNPQ